MRSRPMFAIREDMQQLMDAIGDGGEVEPVLDEYMTRLADEEAVKLDGCIAFLKEMEMEQNAAKEEARYWQDRAAIRANAIGKMKECLLAHLKATGRTEALSASKRRIWIKNNSVVPVILADWLDPKNLPKEFQRITIEVDKAMVKKYLDAGIPLPVVAESVAIVNGSTCETIAQEPFAKLGELGSHLRIS
jgi:Siphovirus Gp157